MSCLQTNPPHVLHAPLSSLSYEGRKERSRAVTLPQPAPLGASAELGPSASSTPKGVLGSPAQRERPNPAGENRGAEGRPGRALRGSRRRLGAGAAGTPGESAAAPGPAARPPAAASDRAPEEEEKEGKEAAAAAGFSDANRRPLCGRWRAAGSCRAPPEVAAMMPALAAQRRGCRSLYGLYLRGQAAPLRRACHGESRTARPCGPIPSSG